MTDWMRRNGALTLPFLVAIIFHSTTDTQAMEIAAIVEEVSDPASGVAPMDLLEEGHVIDLSGAAKLVLGYLRSCIRETITGGRVTVGTERSSVTNGMREESEIDCDGGRVIQSSDKTGGIAGAVFRDKIGGSPPLPKPSWTLFGVSPVIRLSQPAKQIRIQRLDKSGESPIDVPASGDVVDLEPAGIKLEPGGLYSFSDGTVFYAVKISPLAEPDVPLLSRFLPM